MLLVPVGGKVGACADSGSTACPVVIGPVRVAAAWKVTSGEVAVVVAVVAPAPCWVARVSGNSTRSPAAATRPVLTLGTIDARLVLHDMDGPLCTVPVGRCAGDSTQSRSPVAPRGAGDPPVLDRARPPAGGAHERCEYPHRIAPPVLRSPVRRGPNTFVSPFAA